MSVHLDCVRKRNTETVESDWVVKTKNEFWCFLFQKHENQEDGESGSKDEDGRENEKSVALSFVFGQNIKDRAKVGGFYLPVNLWQTNVWLWILFDFSLLVWLNISSFIQTAGQQQHRRKLKGWFATGLPIGEHKLFLTVHLYPKVMTLLAL